MTSEACNSQVSQLKAPAADDSQWKQDIAEIGVNVTLENGKLQKIPRPMNAFMLYAREKRATFKNRFPRLSAKDISTRLGDEWHALVDAEKQVYHKQAKLLEFEHQRKYPNYQYTPGLNQALKDGSVRIEGTDQNVKKVSYKIRKRSVFSNRPRSYNIGPQQTSPYPAAHLNQPMYVPRYSHPTKTICWNASQMVTEPDLQPLIRYPAPKLPPFELNPHMASGDSLMIAADQQPRRQILEADWSEQSATEESQGGTGQPQVIIPNPEGGMDRSQQQFQYTSAFHPIQGRDQSADKQQSEADLAVSTIVSDGNQTHREPGIAEPGPSQLEQPCVPRQNGHDFYRYETTICEAEPERQPQHVYYGYDGGNQPPSQYGYMCRPPPHFPRDLQYPHDQGYQQEYQTQPEGHWYNQRPCLYVPYNHPPSMYPYPPGVMGASSYHADWYQPTTCTNPNSMRSTTTTECYPTTSNYSQISVQTLDPTGHASPPATVIEGSTITAVTKQVEPDANQTEPVPDRVEPDQASSQKLASSGQITPDGRDILEQAILNSIKPLSPCRTTTSEPDSDSKLCLLSNTMTPRSDITPA